MYCIPLKISLGNFLKKEQVVIDCWINKISLSLTPRTQARRRTSLNTVWIAFLYCSLFLSCWLHLRLHQSPPGWRIPQRGCYPAYNNWYQSIPSLSWDRVLIPKASVTVWRRSCVDLEAMLGLFVGSCVDLKTAYRLLEESIWRSRLLRKLFEGFVWRKRSCLYLVCFI